MMRYSPHLQLLWMHGSPFSSERRSPTEQLLVSLAGVIVFQTDDNGESCEFQAREFDGAWLVAMLENGKGSSWHDNLENLLGKAPIVAPPNLNREGRGLLFEKL
eukprot:scaffold4363_cov125-Cylindrotheca_fusiformis.AAC.4